MHVLFFFAPPACAGTASESWRSSPGHLNEGCAQPRCGRLKQSSAKPASRLGQQTFVTLESRRRRRFTQLVSVGADPLTLRGGKDGACQCLLFPRAEADGRVRELLGNYRVCQSWLDQVVPPDRQTGCAQAFSHKVLRLLTSAAPRFCSVSG